MERPVAILYEHPLWFEPLFAELESRDIPYERLHAERHGFDPAALESPYSLVVNRMSPSAWTRGHARAIFHTLDYLAHLDGIGANVLNGFGPYAYELSKARQVALFARLGVRHPATRVINDHAEAVERGARASLPGPREAEHRRQRRRHRLVRAASTSSRRPSSTSGSTAPRSSRSGSRRAATRSSASSCSTASCSTRSASCSCPAASTSAPPTTASFRVSPTASRAAACRSRRSTRRTTSSRTRSASRPPPAWTSAGSSTSSTSATARRTSTT